MDEVRVYFKAVAPILKKHIRNDENPKGSIILLQIENKSRQHEIKNLTIETELKQEIGFLEVVMSIGKELHKL